MNPLAKHLLSLPLTWAGLAGGAVRANLVYLTMLIVISSGWLMAWCKSVDVSERQLIFPALRKDEMKEILRTHDRSGWAVKNPEISSSSSQTDVDDSD